ncbi:MAG: hypothetical protein ACRDT8_16435 [Micromonosporaceae bacterium]
MAKTCKERVESIDGLNTYRDIVSIIETWSGLRYPDPTDYADKLDGDLAGLKKASAALHPDTTTYGQIQHDLADAKSNYQLDEYWKGEASEQFTDGFLVSLNKALKKLDDARETQRKIVDTVHTNMEEKQQNIVDKTEAMVPAVILGAAGVGLAVLAGIALGTVTAGVGAAATTTAAIGGLVIYLNDSHETLQGHCTAFSKTLGENKGTLEELGETPLPEVNLRNVTRASWEVGSGG